MTAADLTAPVDELHAATCRIRDRIRAQFAAAHAAVAAWEPRPMPDGWR